RVSIALVTFWIPKRTMGGAVRNWLTGGGIFRRLRRTAFCLWMRMYLGHLTKRSQYSQWRCCKSPLSIKWLSILNDLFRPSTSQSKFLLSIKEETTTTDEDPNVPLP
ncbi:hypothetical protein PMAYCL1PPCAC_01911, partial [Pristionchus mayeri]